MASRPGNSPASKEGRSTILFASRTFPNLPRIGVNLTNSKSPKGRPHTSPGQRPGFRDEYNDEPQRGGQYDAGEAAPLGLWRFSRLAPQGFALGYRSRAPSGLKLF